ncbi:MAG: glycosyltransferase family 4 protein [Gemmatimonadaceae bacterium]
MRKQRTFVFLSQVYVPDPAAVGQHLADVAEELARRDHRVIVLTADRGYDDPSMKYKKRETIRGVDVRRIPFSSFGKSSIPVRTLGGVFLVFQAIVRSIAIRGIDAVVVSTSPPIGSFGAVVIGMLHRAPVKYWVMDVNPDQMIALGMIGERALPVRVFNWLNRLVLRRAKDVIVLDRFMADRMKRKLDIGGKLTVLPPWPPQDLGSVEHSENPFRKEHGLNGKIVVMYSGNHGPSNPLTTIIEAAKRLANEPRLVLLFVGGGVGKREVEKIDSPNVVSLPYQPQSELRHSLAAADVHIVTVGDRIPGIVHPSKVYGAMAAARPILHVGPSESHVADLLDAHDVGWHIRHGDVDGAERILREIASASPEELREKGQRAHDLIEEMGGKAAACSRVCDVLERGL